MQELDIGNKKLDHKQLTWLEDSQKFGEFQRVLLIAKIILTSAYSQVTQLLLLKKESKKV